MSGSHGSTVVAPDLWEIALDRLELDVLRAEQMLAGGPAHDFEPWDEPGLTGPIPAALLDRARELHDRQQRAAAALRVALADVGRQHAFAARVDRATRAPSTPVYLDLDA